MDQIKIGIGVSSIGRFLPSIALAMGLFDKENIAVEVINRQDEEKIVDDIVAGVTPVGTPNAPSLIFSSLAGNDLVIVGGVLNRPAFFLAANAPIKGIADLKGKRIGINQPRRMAGMVMLALLRRWGFDIEKDLTLVDLGLNDRSLEALGDNQLDAALLPPEKAFLAESQGCSIIADSFELDFHWVPLATTRRFLSENRELVAKIAAFYVESFQIFKTQPEKTVKEIGRLLPALENKPEVLAKCYRVFAERFEESLTPSLTSISSILRDAALQDSRAGDLRAESLIEKVR
mgnify:CR=1 FL=1